MKVEIDIQELGGKEDYYKVKIKTYKEKVEFTAERSEIRQMLGIIDNGIGTSIKQEGKIEMMDPNPDEKTAE